MNLLSLKRHISEHFNSTDWPWEIMSGLFVALLVINYFSPLFVEGKSAKWGILGTVLIVSLFWAIIEGFLFIFTSFLYRGHYNNKIANIQSVNRKSAGVLISAELEESIISMADSKTKRVIKEALLNDFLVSNYDNSHTVKLLSSDVIGALWVVFFSMLPSFALLLIFVLISNVHWAVLISNFIGLIVFFAFGYKLAICTNRNKIVTGFIVAIAGAVLVFAGMLFGA